MPPHHLDKGNYLLRSWGAAAGYPEFKAKYGQPNEPNDRVHAWWFDTDEEREVFKQQLMEFCKTLPIAVLVYDKNSGPLVNKRTTVVVTLKYLGKEYKVRKDYGYGYPLGTAIFDWEENNCSAWSNRLSYIEDEYHLEFDHDALSETTHDYDVFVIDFQFKLFD
jgi:hypothetical protein